MKKLLSHLIQHWNAFLGLFSAPAHQSCPHCGGGRCFGACQFSRERENSRGSKTPRG